jgi:hypothetical protein
MTSYFVLLVELPVGMHSIGKRLGRFVVTPQLPESAT